MKIPKLIHLETYDVIWIDNNIFSQQGWVEHDDLQEYIKNHATSLIHTAGILYAQDKMFITLIQSHDIEENLTTMNAIKISTKDILSIYHCKSKKIYEQK